MISSYAMLISHSNPSPMPLRVKLRSLWNCLPPNPKISGSYSTPFWLISMLISPISKFISGFSKKENRSKTGKMLFPSLGCLTPSLSASSPNKAPSLTPKLSKPKKLAPSNRLSSTPIHSKPLKKTHWVLLHSNCEKLKPHQCSLKLLSLNQPKIFWDLFRNCLRVCQMEIWKKRWSRNFRHRWGKVWDRNGVIFCRGARL